MNKNILRGLVVGIALIILLVVLYVFLIRNPRPTGPAQVTTPTPPAATSQAVPPATTAPSQAVPPPAAAPAPPAGPEAKPGVPPLGAAGASKGAPPLTEATHPEPQVTVLPPQKAKNQYGILVGSYRKYPSAAKMLSKLEKKKVPGFIHPTPGKRHRFQVWAGPFATASEAKTARKSLHTRYRRGLRIHRLKGQVPK